MRPLVSDEQARALDRQAQELGIEDGLLMELAGARMWERLRPDLPAREAPVLFLCGPGHNGGDALVAARHAVCAGHSEVAVHLVSESLKPLTSDQLRRYRACGGRVVGVREVQEWLQRRPLVVEGVSGVGRLPAEAEDLVQVLGRSGLRVVALDVPCGLDRGPLYQAERTLCVLPLKRALFEPRNRPAVGRIEPIPLPWPPGLRGRIEREAMATLVRRRDLVPLLRRAAPGSFAHKGTRGRVGVFAGSGAMFGAGVLACRAAVLVAGVVEWFVEPELAPAARLAVLGPLVHERDRADLPALDGRFRSALIGPGMNGAEALEWARRAAGWGIPLVLDAGALVPELLGAMAKTACVVTPHPGELARLLGVPTARILADPTTALSSLPSAWVVVLKSQPLWVAHGGRFWVFDVQNPALGFGGSGDILAGLTVALAARLPLLRAALCAVALHQLAAARALAGRWLDPEALLAGLKSTLREVWHA